MDKFSESTVEDAALSWLDELGYSIAHGPEIAPDCLTAERAEFSEVFLTERLRAALWKLNPNVPAEAIEEAFRKVTIPQSPSLIVNNRSFHRMHVEGIALECRREDGTLGAEIAKSSTSKTRTVLAGLVVESDSMKAIRAINKSEIKRLCDQIAREFHPHKIILFGSHAYGNPQWDSDVDLLVIMPFKGTPHSQAVEIRSRIRAGIALDLLVRTPQQVEQRLEMGDSFMCEIFERGKVIYEADHA